MKITRRQFMRASGVAAVGTHLGGCAGLSLTSVEKHAANLRKDLKSAKATTTICPYCAVGCGAVVHASRGKVINIEGDPDHVISRGSLCSKGAALYELATTKNRVKKVRYRAPYSDKWEEKSWDWAFKAIAARIKKVRDADFIARNKKGQVVNRVESLVSTGSAAMDNEECWLYQAFLRAMGLVYIEHQARI